MRILVTGGSGFLGSHVADFLTQTGHEVVIMDAQPSPYLRQDQEMVVGSILDEKAVRSAVEDCQAIYHFAALADIDRAIHQPKEAVETNIVGTLNLLLAAQSIKLKRFVYASSIYVYSKQGSFYRTTKQAAENLIADFQERYGLDFTILRFGSLYGPRSGEANPIYRLLKQALVERSLTYTGTGEEIREYIHVSDAAAMAVDVLDKSYTNEIIHLTGRERMRTRDIMTMIAEMLGPDIEVSFSNTPKVGHYQQTPYSYVPRVGRKLTKKTYVDLGLGLLECLDEISTEIATSDMSSSGHEAP